MADTPNTAKKIDNFSITQEEYNKASLRLNGKDVNAFVFNVNHISSIIINENYYYYFVSDAVINDNSIIEDSDSTQYTCYLYNQSSISIDQLFGLNIKNNIAYLYPL